MVYFKIFEAFGGEGENLTNSTYFGILNFAVMEGICIQQDEFPLKKCPFLRKGMCSYVRVWA